MSRWLVVACGLLLVVCLTGCSRSSDASSVGLGAKGYTIGVSQSSLDEPWRVQMNADLTAAARRHPSLKLVFKDAKNDPLQQQAQVEEFIAAKVNLIIISPEETQALTEPVAKAYRAKIPVIVLQRPVIGDDYTCFIGADNKKIGRAAGQWLVKRLGGKGKIVELMGLMSSTASQDRNNGFEESLVHHPDMRLLFQVDMKWQESDARKETEAILAKYEKIDAVFAHNDAGAHGAYLAAQAAGREKGMIFVGVNAMPGEGAMYLKKGMLSATILYPTGGAEAIDAAVKILAGQPVPKRITLSSRIFTPENVDHGGEPLP